MRPTAALHGEWSVAGVLHKVRIAFNICATTQFRLFGPVIDRALELGWDVECWCNQSVFRDGLKSYMFPATEAIPRFQHGQPIVRTYSDSAEFDALERGNVETVVTIRPLQFDTNRSHTRQPVRICLQSLLDTFVNHSLETLASYDLVALQTPWWTNWAASYYEVTTGSSDAAALQARLTQRIAHIGFPELDARRLVDRDEVRRRWNIPRDQPVVLLLPFSQGVGRASFWPRKIFGEPRRMRRLLHLVRHRQFTQWRRVFNDPSEADVVRAVRSFCDRSGAFLLVKSRRKAPIPDYMRAIADKCLYDETYYPPTILEALSVASLCISFYSASVLEAAAMAVPNMCITFSAEDYLGDEVHSVPSFQRFLNREEKGVFQFRGVSETVTIEEAIAALLVRRLDEFAIDPDARRAFVHKFIGEDDCQSSARVVDAIAAATESRAAK